MILMNRLTRGQVSAGGFHTLLLRSDGRVVACGSDLSGQCQIPPLDERLGQSYSEVHRGVNTKSAQSFFC